MCIKTNRSLNNSNTILYNFGNFVFLEIGLSSDIFLTHFLLFIAIVIRWVFHEKSVAACLEILQVIVYWFSIWHTSKYNCKWQKETSTRNTWKCLLQFF